MEATARGIHRRIIFAVDESLRSRFTSRVLRRNDDECWQWLGGIRNGYGAIGHCGRTLSAHVVAWSIAAGRGPAESMIICHTCDDRLCCNPQHLYEGTYADNVHDMDHRRALQRIHGVMVPNAVLNDDLVRLILSLTIVDRLGPWRIAKRLGLNKRTVEKAITRETWRHVPLPSTDEAAAIVHQWNSRHAS